MTEKTKKPVDRNEPWGVQARLLKMTPEERKQYYIDVHRKRRATLEAKAHAEEILRAKAEEMKPMLLAEQLLMQGEDTRPSQRVIEQLKDLMEKGMTLEQMRGKLFSRASEKAWANLTKWLFQDHAPNAESMGLDILRTKQRAIRDIKQYVREVRKLIREEKSAANKSGRKSNLLGLLDRKRAAERDLANIEMDVAKVLYQVGAVGAKKRGGSGGGVTLNFNIPRPPTGNKVVPNDEPKDVTPRKSLSELMSPADGN